MKLKTVGLLFSLVCAITLGSAKGNAVANEMKVAKNQITAVVKDAVVEQIGLIDMEFEKEGKKDDGNEELEELFEEKIDFSLIDELKVDPANYDPITVNQEIFSKLSTEEMNGLRQYLRRNVRLMSKYERSFLGIVSGEPVTNEKSYQEYVEEEFIEEIEEARGMTRAYYYSNHPQVYQGNQNSLFNALMCLLPAWVVALFLSEVIVAAGSINIPIFGQAIAAAAILALAVTIIAIFYLLAQIFVEVVKCICDFIGAKNSSKIKGWFRQIKGKVWDDNKKKAYSSLKAEYGATTVKWKNESEMDKALNQALKIGAHATSVSAVKSKFQDDEDLRVYIGKNTDSPNYVTLAARDKYGIAFSMPEYLWNSYEAQGYDMWILNKYFLKTFAGVGTEFRLCSDPKLYINGSSYYGRELRYLKNEQKYSWPAVFKPYYIQAFKTGN